MTQKFVVFSVWMAVLSIFTACASKKIAEDSHLYVRIGGVTHEFRRLDAGILGHTAFTSSKQTVYDRHEVQSAIEQTKILNCRLPSSSELTALTTRGFLSQDMAQHELYWAASDDDKSGNYAFYFHAVTHESMDFGNLTFPARLCLICDSKPSGGLHRAESQKFR
jgi:hypothetical protein